MRSEDLGSETNSHAVDVRLGKIKWWQYVLIITIPPTLSTLLSYFLVRSPSTTGRIDDVARSAVADASLPIVGEIRAFAFDGEKGEVAIEELRKRGWAECAGQFLHETQNTQNLRKVLSERKNWGSQAGIIRLPDLRGEFLRGWNHGSGRDPDVELRIPEAGSQGGRDSVGSNQLSAIQDHTHKEQISQAIVGASPSGIAGTLNQGSNEGNLNTSGAVVSEKSGGVSRSETRPVNVYVMYAIYVGNVRLSAEDVDYAPPPPKQ